MLLIPCPHCGPRDESEFTYGGPARPLPPLDGPIDNAQAAFFRMSNPRGPAKELWFHTSGCACWITIVRDTHTHAIEGHSP